MHFIRFCHDHSPNISHLRTHLVKRKALPICTINLSRFQAIMCDSERALPSRQHDTYGKFHYTNTTPRRILLSSLIQRIRFGKEPFSLFPTPLESVLRGKKSFFHANYFFCSTGRFGDKPFLMGLYLVNICNE